MLMLIGLMAYHHDFYGCENGANLRFTLELMMGDDGMND